MNNAQKEAAAQALLQFLKATATKKDALDILKIAFATSISKA